MQVECDAGVGLVCKPALNGGQSYVLILGITYPEGGYQEIIGYTPYGFPHAGDCWPPRAKRTVCNAKLAGLSEGSYRGWVD